MLLILLRRVFKWCAQMLVLLTRTFVVSDRLVQKWQPLFVFSSVIALILIPILLLKWAFTAVILVNIFSRVECLQLSH